MDYDGTGQQAYLPSDPSQGIPPPDTGFTDPSTPDYTAPPVQDLPPPAYSPPYESTPGFDPGDFDINGQYDPGYNFGF